MLFIPVTNSFISITIQNETLSSWSLGVNADFKQVLEQRKSFKKTQENYTLIWSRIMEYEKCFFIMKIPKYNKIVAIKVGNQAIWSYHTKFSFHEMTNLIN